MQQNLDTCHPLPGARLEAGPLLLVRLWRHAQAIPIAVEQNTGVFACGAFHWLYPVTPAERFPHALEEAEGAVLGVTSIVTAHDLLDGLGGFVGIVKGDGADIMVENMSLDDAVHQMSANEAEFTVDGRRSTTSVRPRLGKIMGKGRIGMLQIGDGH